ncbi:MAG: hypothetical protein QM529_07070 [Hydrotalea sp.]|nr:hypothetical protein [Hydrotalea sp.]
MENQEMDILKKNNPALPYVSKTGLPNCCFCNKELIHAGEDKNTANQHIIPNALIKHFNLSTYATDLRGNGFSTPPEFNSLLFSNDKMGCKDCENKITAQVREKDFVEFFTKDKIVTGDILIKNFFWIILKIYADYSQRAEGAIYDIINPKLSFIHEPAKKTINEFIGRSPNKNLNDAVNGLKKMFVFTKTQLEIFDNKNIEREMSIKCFRLPFKDEVFKEILRYAKHENFSTQLAPKMIILGLLFNICDVSDADAIDASKEYSYNNLKMISDKEKLDKELYGIMLNDELAEFKEKLLT